MKPRLRFSLEHGWLPQTANPASLQLLRRVRAGFMLKGTTLTEWCRQNGTHISNARNALIGTWDGPKGQAMRAKLVMAAGVRVAA